MDDCSEELLEEMAKIFGICGVEVKYMIAPTSYNREGKVIAAESIRFGSADIVEEIAKFLAKRPLKTAYLYKAGWLEMPEGTLPYLRIGRELMG